MFFSYIQYSNVCAKVVRRCLKAQFKPDAEKRGESMIRGVKWENGKPVVDAGATSKESILPGVHKLISCYN